MSDQDTTRLVTPDGKWEFDIGSDIRVSHYDECGTPQTMIVDYVQVSNKRGDRWAHDESFGQEHGESSLDLDARARRLAASFVQRYEEGWTPEDNPHWRPARPVYCSEAYFADGYEEAERMDDLRDDSDGIDISHVC